MHVMVISFCCQCQGPLGCLLEADETPAFPSLLGVPLYTLGPSQTPLGVSLLRLCNALLCTSSQSLKRDVREGCYIYQI